MSSFLAYHRSCEGHPSRKAYLQDVALKRFTFILLLHLGVVASRGHKLRRPLWVPLSSNLYLCMSLEQCVCVVDLLAFGCGGNGRTLAD